MLNDDLTIDMFGKDEQPEKPRKKKLLPVTIEDENTVLRIAAQYDSKEFMIYKFDQLANAALNDDKPQYNSAVTAYANIAKIKGFSGETKTVINNNLSADLSSLSYEEKMSRAKEISERLQMH